MSFVTDIRPTCAQCRKARSSNWPTVSTTCPRPLLAAIGAGDLAVEQLAALRESLMEQFADLGAAAG